MNDEYLYIFFHTPKAAGSTLIYHLRENFHEEEVLSLGYTDLKLDSMYRNHPNKYQIIKRHAGNLSVKKTKELKVLFGHCAYYGIHNLFKSKTKYITFVREPVARTVSLYNYIRTIYEKEDIKGRNKKFYKYQLLINQRIPEFDEWVSIKYGKFNSALETMHQLFQTYGYLDKKINKTSIQKMIDKFYFIGLTENFDNDSAFLYGKLGINKFFTNKNKSYKYVRFPIREKTMKTIKRKNKIDFQIYEAAKKANAEFVSKNKEYTKLASLIQKKRKFVFVHQIVFDFSGTLRAISAWLRKNSPVYSRFLDKIKGIER